MTFADIPAGVTLFLDANVLLYHFTGDPTFGQACNDLLLRISRGEIAACTSPHVLAEVAHRLMTIEASHAFGWSLSGIVPKLRNHPAQVQTLKQAQSAVQQLPGFGITVIPTTYSSVNNATALTQQFGLLTNDALIIAVMQHHGLNQLASNDGDFDRVPGITRYAPA